MKNILIVEDDDALRLYLKKCLTSMRFAVSTAGNGIEALGEIEKKKPDLLLTDLHMPGMDGFELVARLSQTDPKLPVIVMTGVAGAQDRLDPRGGMVCLQKPIDYETLAEEIQRRFDQAAGVLSGISLVSFAQVLNLEKKSCSLLVRSNGRDGRLYFVAGELVDAATDDDVGLTAALSLLAWDAAEIQIQRVEPRPVRIAMPLRDLLAEAIRLVRETSEVQLQGSVRHVAAPDIGMPAGLTTAASGRPSTVTQEIRLDAIPASRYNEARKGKEMANAKESLEKLAGIDGFIGGCLVDSNSGMMMGSVGGGSINLEVAAAANTEVVRAKRQAMAQLKLNDAIEDILITLGKQYHLIRPISAKEGLFVYLVLDRAKANLGMGRYALGEMEKALVL